MARIAVVVSNPCTADSRVIKMAEAASKAGHDVHIFATTVINTQNFEKLRGVTYHRLIWNMSHRLRESFPLSWTVGAFKGFAAKRIAPFVKFSQFRSVFANSIASINPDIIHAHDLICLPAGAAAAKISGAMLVYDAHELETHRFPPQPFFQRLMVKYIERKYAQKVDAIITVGNLVAQVLGKHIGRRDITVIYNTPIVNPCPQNIRRDLNLADDKELLIYVGKVAEGRGLRTVIDLLHHLPRAVFAAVGPCDVRTRKRLELYASKKGMLPRFHILPPVPPDHVVNYIRGANLGIISVNVDTLSYRYGMPNKLFEMAFAGVPILCNPADEMAMFLSELGNGESVNFDIPENIPNIVARMLQEQDQYVIGAEKQSLMECKYSWSAQEVKLLDLYKDLLERRQVVGTR
jgi:glycosyltransferase involved in cell wall biosynthesis